MFPLVMPSVKDLWSYGETGYHALAGAVVEQRYRREAMQAAFRILGEGQLSLTKFLWVTDQAVDLRDARATLTHLLERFQPETDLYVLSNLSMDTLDYSGPEINLGSKGILLGVGDPVRSCPKEFRGTLPSGLTQAAAFCPDAWWSRDHVMATTRTSVNGLRRHFQSGRWCASWMMRSLWRPARRALVGRIYTL